MYPKPVDRWWTMQNLTRLAIWISFWTTFYFFIDTIYVTGWRRIHPDLDQRSSIFPSIMAAIYFSVLMIHGFILAQNAKLSRKDATSMGAFVLWGLLEVFLIAITMIYRHHINNHLGMKDLLVLLRLVLVCVAFLRLKYLFK